MAKKVSKRIAKLSEKIDSSKFYSIEDAINLIKTLSSTKFDETVEIALRLGVDPRHADQMVRGAVVLPHGIGKKVRVAVFAKDLKANEAREAGADVVGDEDLVEIIKNGDANFDIVISTPDMMPLVGRVGRILGPKGIMPNPKVGTVTAQIAQAVKNAKSGQVNIRVDKKGNIHGPIGKVSFDKDRLLGNMFEFVRTVNKLKPTTTKGKYIKSGSLSLTMSPGLKVDTQELMEVK